MNPRYQILTCIASADRNTDRWTEEFIFCFGVLVLFCLFVFFCVGVFLQRVVRSYPCNGTTLNIQLPPAFQLAEHVCPRDLEKGGTSRERLATVFYHF